MFHDQSYADPDAFKIQMMGMALQRLQGVGLEMEKRQQRLNDLLGNIIETVDALGSQQKAAVYQQITMAIGPVLDSRLATSDHLSRAPKCSAHSVLDSDKNHHPSSLHQLHPDGVTGGQGERLRVMHYAADQGRGSTNLDTLEHEMSQEIEEFFFEGLLNNDGFEVPCIVTSTEVLGERVQQAQEIIDNTSSGAQGVLTSCDLAPCIMTTTEKLGNSQHQNGIITAKLNHSEILSCIDDPSKLIRCRGRGHPSVQLQYYAMHRHHNRADWRMPSTSNYRPKCTVCFTARSADTW
jgi:hypothetical protein